MKFILISPKNRTAYNFRGDLIKKIIACGYEVVVTGPDRDNVERIEELGARFVEIPMNKNGVNPLEDLNYQKALCELFKKEKPDVTLGYTSKPVIYGAIAAKKAGVPHIVSMVTGAGYAFTAESTKAKIIKTIMSVLYRKAFRCADTVIFQNDDDKAEFLSMKLLKAEKCRVVNGSGVNTVRFMPAAYPEKISFFMLSRFLKSKGVREYLEAARLVKEKHPEVDFYLLGKYETEMQDAIPKEEIEQYINDGIVTRFDETNDVRPYYEKCSVYVLPSYREGTPRTVLEAMSMGRAVITTDTQGCRGTVIDGKTGYLVPVKNSQAVAEKMLTFIENPELISQMGAESAKYCCEKFDVNIVNNDMCKYLNIEKE